MKLDLPNSKKGKLARIDVKEDAVFSKNPLRTLVVEGLFTAEPTKGQPFRFFSEPLDKALDFRLISTSTVQAVEKSEGKIRFYTLNSTYELTPSV